MTGTHLIAAPEPAPSAEASGPWMKLSAAFTEQISDLTDREDLTVTCAPGAGRGAPGAFVPALATVELDGDHLGHDPDTCDPASPSDRERYPALWGVLVHEAAHARHSGWTTAHGQAPAAHVDAAVTLEESRIEAAHLRRRPADRHWLRASASKLILADFTGEPAAPATPRTPAAPASPTSPCAAMTPWDAARAAALLLARVDAGVLDEDETTTLAATIKDVLGASRLSALSALWHIAHSTADDDADTMLDLGRRWCAILGVDPDQPAPETAEAETAGSPGDPSPLAAAITTTLTAVAVSDASPAPAGSEEAKQRRAEKAARERTERAARRVFTPAHATHPDPRHRSGPTAITGTRPPTPKEKAAARRVGRALRAAGHRERTSTKTTSATPPGRLRMRAALAADAQRAAGATPTAEPFTQITSRHLPAPPLRLGIACDVSGSMFAAADPVASAAWILARAAAHVPDTRSATVIFGSHVRPVTYPGHTPTHVRTFTAADDTEDFCGAVDALDAALELTRPGAARLLVIVSDGRFTRDQRKGGQDRITRLTASGCAVLWLALDTYIYPALPMDGAHLVTLTDPAEATATIGHAAARALRHA